MSDDRPLYYSEELRAEVERLRAALAKREGLFATLVDVNADLGAELVAVRAALQGLQTAAEAVLHDAAQNVAVAGHPGWCGVTNDSINELARGVAAGVLGEDVNR